MWNINNKEGVEGHRAFSEQGGGATHERTVLQVVFQLRVSRLVISEIKQFGLFFLFLFFLPTSDSGFMRLYMLAADAQMQEVSWTF